MPEPINNHLDEFKAIIPNLPPGAIVEFGVYEGGSTEQLLTFGRTVYAFDTFTGMPPYGAYSRDLDGDNVPGKFIPRPSVEDHLRSLGVVTIRGEFSKTFEVYTLPERVAFAYIDCDWYSSHIECLQYILPYMVPGGKLFFDDYPNLAGAKNAVEEIFGSRAARIVTIE